MVSVSSKAGWKPKWCLPFLLWTFLSLSPTHRDPEISLLQNLRELLEIDFPSRAVLEKSVSWFWLMIGRYC